MHCLVWLIPICINVFLSRFPAKLLDSLTDRLHCLRKWLLKRHDFISLPSVSVDFLYHGLISAVFLCYMVVCRRSACSSLCICKDGHILIDLRKVAVPSKPTVLTRLKPTPDRCGGRNRSRWKYRMIVCFFASEKESIPLQTSLHNF